MRILRFRFCPILSGGVMVAQGPLEALVMVRVHAGQPTFPFPNFSCIFGKMA